MGHDLTVVVPYWNGEKHLGRLLGSLPESLPVIVVDDHSDQPLQVSARYTLLRPPQRGYFAGAVNAALAACDGDVLILNQDAQLHGTAWLDLLLAERKRYAMIGERIRGTHPAWPNGYVHGTFTYLRRDAIQAVGPMNAIDYPLWGSTCEYQLRLCRAGFEVLPLQQVPGLVHNRPGRFGEAITETLRREGKRELFIRTPPMISVVVPCFNYGHYLLDLINSLIGGPTCLGNMPGQTFQSFEVIIVDDASTDDTPDIAQALADPWKAIHYIRLPRNVGTAACINAGVARSWGKYVTIISADDMAEPWYLEGTLRCAEKHPHSVVYSDMILFKNGKRFDILTLPDYDFERVLYKNGMGANLLYPKEAWREVGGYPEIMRDGREDWAFNVGLGLRGWCGVKAPGQPGYLCRREGHNRSLRNAGPGWADTFMSRLMALYPDAYRGDRPMTCCGGGRSKVATKFAKGAGTAATFQMPGRDGLQLLEYVGTNVGTSTWWGAVTGARYEFGANDSARVKYVDVRDAPAMLALRDTNKCPLFRPYKAPPAPAPIPPEPILAPEEIEAGVVAEPVEDLTAIPGVGKATAARLVKQGILTREQLAAHPPLDLAEKLGISLKRAQDLVEAAE